MLLRAMLMARTFQLRLLILFDKSRSRGNVVNAVGLELTNSDQLTLLISL